MSEAGSGIEGFRHSSRLAEYVAGRLTRETFKLVDIGCAGGLAQGWRAFGDRLSAVGFDTNAEEVARLSAAETNPRVKYVAGWVGMPADHPLKQRIGNKAFWHQWPAGRLAYERTYDLRRALQDGREPQSVDAYFHDLVLKQDWSTLPIQGFDLDYDRTFEVFPPPPDDAAEVLAATGPDAVIHLPPYLQAGGFYDADFVKLDIDGPDYEVLRSISGLLAQPSLLGVSVEVCFFGSHDANDNSFHNVDRLMREKGFDLFGLSVRTYASAALPFPYLDSHPTQNTGGRVGQGDAIYIRDLGSRVRREEAAAVSTEKLAKTAAVFALAGLPDHAAEILLTHKDRLAALFNIDQALDMLAAELQGEHVIAEGYHAYLAAFEADDPRFYNRRPGPPVAQVAASLEDRVRAEAAERALAEAQGALSLSRAELAAITASRSWKLTAPLRSLVTALRPRA